jgi:MFS family permease
VIRGLELVTSGPFARATLTNFFFMSSLSCFILLPLYVHRLGGTEAEIGLVQGVYSAAGILCQPVIGLWLDRIGRRFFMALGVALLIASSAAFLVSHSMALLAALRVVQGLGFSAFFVANYMHVVDLVPAERRGWALGIYGVSGFVATAFAPLLGEFIVRRAGFRALFAVSAVLALVPLVLVLRLRDARKSGGASLPAPGWLRAGLEDVVQRHMVVTLFFGLGSGTIFAFLPTFAQSLEVSGLSLFYTAYAAAAIAVRIFGGRLIDTRGRRAIIVPSMFLQTLAPALLAVVGVAVTRTSTTPVVPILFVAGLVSGAAHGFLYPGLAALVTDLTAVARRATAVGVFSAMFLLGQTAGAFVFGAVAHALGYASMWTILTMLLLIGASLSVGLARPAAS